jgi:hypothetical protein
MDDERSLKRPLLAPRMRRTTIMLAAALATMFAAGIGVGVTVYNAQRVEHISMPAPEVTVTVPAATPPTIAVNVPAPAPAPDPVVTPVATPTEQPPRPRTPKIWPQCVYVAPGEEDGVCLWDDGFPAISADGRLIASKHIPDDAGRGNPGLEIWFTLATGKVVGRTVVLSPDEFEVDDGTNSAKVARLQKSVYARVAEVQRTLDDGAYRSMARLGQSNFRDTSSDEPASVHTGVYADIGFGGAVRIVDPATNSVIWQHQFGVAGGREPNEDELCGGWGLWSMELWWDEPTRVVLASEWYRTGGCMCSDVPVVEVAHIP